MVNGPTSPSSGVRKVRRGTRSCWECRRRKVRCRFPSDDAPTCEWCLLRGFECVSQLHADAPTDQSDAATPARLRRIETMLEELVAKVDQSAACCRKSHLTHGMVREDGPGNDVLTDASPLNHPASGGGILSLFNNSIFKYTSSAENNISSRDSRPAAGPLPASSKMARLSAHLLSMVPSNDAITALEIASKQWIMHFLDAIPSFRSKPDFSLLDAFTPVSPATSPAVVARGLMCFVLCLQQLPKDYNFNRITQCNNRRDWVDEVTSSIFSLVTADDELVATLEGIECLILQIIFFINEGQPRRAWLSARRAIAIAQLLGLHRHTQRAADEGACTERKSYSSVWPYICHSERFLALILGVPNGVHDEWCSRPDSFEELQDDSIDLPYLHQLDLIAGRIIAREKNVSQKELLATQTIQDELERLAESIPSSWWAIPSGMEDPDQIPTGISYRRLTTQIWHFQLEISLNLPFMFSAISSVKFEYSQLCCLRAARELIKRHALARKSTTTFSCCLTNFQAFMAALILTINLLRPGASHGPRQSEAKKQADWATVSQVVLALDAISARFDDRVALQSVNVLKTLRGLEFEPNKSVEDIRLTIPYFGTIWIGRRVAPTDTTGHRRENHGPGSSENQEMEPSSLEEWSELFTIDLDVDGFSQFPPAPDVLLQNWSSGPSTYSWEKD